MYQKTSLQSLKENICNSLVTELVKTCDKLAINPELRSFKNYLTNMNKSLFLLFLSNLRHNQSILFRINEIVIELKVKNHFKGVNIGDKKSTI